MSSKPGFTVFPRLPMEIRLRIWQHAFPTIDNSERTIRIDITCKANLVILPSGTYPTQVAWDYTLTASLAPPPPPLVSRELHLEYLRRYPSTLELLPDPNPLHPTQPPPGQRIRFNPLRDTIFVPLPTLYSFSNILTSPPSLDTLNRLIGFDQILSLSTPLENPNIRGLAFLESWLFTSLPPLPSPSSDNDKDTAPNLLSKIYTDLSFSTSSPETDMRSALRIAEQDMVGNLAKPTPTPEQALELSRRARRHHVWRPLRGVLGVETADYYITRGALGDSAVEWAAVRRLEDSHVLGMKEGLWEFFEEGEQPSE